MTKVQLNVRISKTTLAKLRKVAKSTGRSLTWIVDDAISKAIGIDKW